MRAIATALSFLNPINIGVGCVKMGLIMIWRSRNEMR
jgi:hypothetical protein